MRTAVCTCRPPDAHCRPADPARRPLSPLRLDISGGGRPAWCRCSSAGAHARRAGHTSPVFSAIYDRFCPALTARPVERPCPVRRVRRLCTVDSLETSELRSYFRVPVVLEAALGQFGRSCGTYVQSRFFGRRREAHPRNAGHPARQAVESLPHVSEFLSKSLKSIRTITVSRPTQGVWRRCNIRHRKRLNLTVHRYSALALRLS